MSNSIFDINRIKGSLRGRRSYEIVSGLRHRRTSFSQFGEDVYLQSFYERLAFAHDLHVTNGWIVDIGAYRPISYSNTYGLYRRGWRCINIDPTPGFKDVFDKVRPRDVNLQVAVAPSPTKCNFYMFGQPSVYNTMDAEAANRTQELTGQRPRIEPVEVLRLDSIIEKHDVGDQFEILSIDTEGLDIEILESNDFQRFRPRIIVIEVHGFDFRTIDNDVVVDFMKQHDYQLYAWINPNLMFVRSDSVV